MPNYGRSLLMNLMKMHATAVQLIYALNRKNLCASEWMVCSCAFVQLYRSAVLYSAVCIVHIPSIPSWRQHFQILQG